MKKLLTVSILMLAFCVLFVCTAPAQASFMSFDSTTKKIWSKNGDCEIRHYVYVENRRRSIQANHGYYPCYEVRYYKEGRSYILLDDLRETGYGAGNEGIWMEGSITIPKAYLVDFKVTLHVGYSRSGADRVQEYCDSINTFLDQGILRPNKDDKTTFEKCSREDIERLITEGDQDKRFWTSRKDNPPRVSLDSYNYSGDWSAGTFTQTYILRFNVTCEGSRSFSIKIKYLTSDGYNFKAELEAIKLELGSGIQSKTITVTIPQSGLSRHQEYNKSKSPIFITDLSVRVDESVAGHEPISTFYDLKVGAKVTIN